MSTKHEKQESKAAKPARRARVHWTTIVAAIVCVPLAFVSWRSFRGWHELSRHESALENELERLNARNEVLQPAYEAMQNQKFQVCNKSADTVTIPWVSVLYHDGKQLKHFDALHCEGWRPQVVPSGGNKVLNFSSSQEGCNWNGAVAFYAFRLVRESDEGVRAYNVTGPWRGFDRDCFTVE